MPVQMSKKKQKAYFKRLRKNIYEKEFNRVKTEQARVRRKNRVEEIKQKARDDAKFANMSRAAKLQVKLRSLQEKRDRLSKKVSPFVDNLNKQFDLSKYKK